MNFLLDKKFQGILLTVIVFELLLAGSGRVLSIGSVTLRMMLFCLAMTSVATHLYLNGPKKIPFMNLVAAFLLLVSVGVCQAIRNGASINAIFTDAKQQVFFVMILYFTWQINDLQKVGFIAKSIKTSSMILAVFYILSLSFMLTGFTNYRELYEKFGDSSLLAYQEVTFRGVMGFYFYKSFVFIPVGMTFFVFEKKPKNRIWIAFFLYLALFLTLMRWLVLTTVFVLVAYYVYEYMAIRKKTDFRRWIQLSGIIAITVACKDLFLLALGDKGSGDKIRENQLVEWTDMLRDFSWFEHLAGKGFGNGLVSRPVHMEFMYAEIYYKQGILGIAFWMGLFLLCTRYFLKIRGSNNEQLAIPFILSAAIIYMQSFTNPFLINSIGMTVVILSLVALRLLVENRQFEKT